MKFSVLIPAYNEGPRIASVIRAALASDKVYEVIVVNDGSTDNTGEIIEQFSDRKLRKIHQENGGKTQAILQGVQRARGDYIIMIDADLLGFSSRHIDMLIAPLEGGVAEVVISLRENSLPFYKFLSTDFVSGERIVPRTLFDDPEYYLSKKRFGLEVLMNEKILQKHLRVKNVYLPGVITPRKSMKSGLFRGTMEDIRMILDIVGSVSPWKIIRQMWYFSRFSPQGKNPR